MLWRLFWWPFLGRKISAGFLTGLVKAYCKYVNDIPFSIGDIRKSCHCCQK